MKRIVGLIMVLFGLSVQTALADIPGTINFQGRLTDLAGNAVANGTYGVTFTLHYQAVGNSPTGWSEVQNVSTERGYFNIALGDNTPLTTLDFKYPYYLEIHVAGDAQPMNPRQPLASVPYAMRAKEANNANYANNANKAMEALSATTAAVANSIANNTVNSSKIVDASIASADIANDAVTTSKLPDGAVTQPKALFAPIVAVEGAWRNYPKIACGTVSTNVNGDIGVNISAYGFTAAPIILATIERSDVNVCVRIYDRLTTGFSVKTFYLNGTGTACIINWMAIGY
jgi:hypothetical protein